MNKQKDLPLPQTDLPLPQKDLPVDKQELSTGSEAKSISKNKWIIFIISALAILFATLIGGYLLAAKNSAKPVACTLEAKICPDGSSVGRTGPKCEFAKCPVPPTPTSIPDITGDWIKYSNSAFGINMKYPKYFYIMSENSTLINFGNKNETNLDSNLPFFTISKKLTTYTTNQSCNATTPPCYSKGIPLSVPDMQGKHFVYVIGDGAAFEYFQIHNPDVEFKSFAGGGDPYHFMNQILSTVTFSSDVTASPTPTCKPRPACLDATPKCMIAETSDMCPPVTPQQ